MSLSPFGELVGLGQQFFGLGEAIVVQVELGELQVIRHFVGLVANLPLELLFEAQFLLLLAS